LRAVLKFEKKLKDNVYIDVQIYISALLLMWPDVTAEVWPMQSHFQPLLCTNP